MHVMFLFTVLHIKAFFIHPLLEGRLLHHERGQLLCACRVAVGGHDSPLDRGDLRPQPYIVNSLYIILKCKYMCAFCLLIVLLKTNVILITES